MISFFLFFDFLLFITLFVGLLHLSLFGYYFFSVSIPIFLIPIAFVIGIYFHTCGQIATSLWLLIDDDLDLRLVDIIYNCIHAILHFDPLLCVYLSMFIFITLYYFILYSNKS